MNNSLKSLLEVPTSRVGEINALLLAPDNRAIKAFLEVVERY
jgi:hypothetical protein